MFDRVVLLRFVVSAVSDLNFITLARSPSVLKPQPGDSDQIRSPAAAIVVDIFE